MKQWFISLIIIGVAHGAILFSQSPSLYEGENSVVLAYHQGEDAGIKYRVSLISKTPQKDATHPKQKKTNKQSQNNTNMEEQSLAGGATSTPKLIGKFTPPYHPAARRRREQGDVTVTFTVLPNGTVVSATIVSSSRNPRLDQSALAYIKQLTFTPAQIGGSAVKTKQELTISYRVK